MKLAASALLLALLAFGEDPPPMSDGPVYEPGKLVWADVSGLPEGEHRELVAVHCTACHHAEVFTQQRLSRRRWADLIAWMQAEQNMWELDEPSHERILDYLADRLGAQGAENGGWYEHAYPPNPLW